MKKYASEELALMEEIHDKWLRVEADQQGADLQDANLPA